MGIKMRHKAAGAVRALIGGQRTPAFHYLFIHSLNNIPEQKKRWAILAVEHTFLLNLQGSYRPAATDLEGQRHMVGTGVEWQERARNGTIQPSP
jgi:hypothetical protein